jgi:hypothetical protein
VADYNDQAEMEALVGRSRSRQQLDYADNSPLPVKAGPGRIIKGSLMRLTGDKSYGAGMSVSNANGTMVAFENVTRTLTKDTNPYGFVTTNAPSTGSGVILGSKLTKNTMSINNVSFRIWLYQVNFATSLNPASEDGSPLQIRWRRRDDRIGYLDFLDFTMGFDCAESYAYVGLGQSILFSTITNNLYGLVQTLTPYQAISQEQFDFYLHVASD